ncbi:glycoside hydrolase family 73 protein [Acidocella aromatica]|uniref:Flagellar protein FlgJ n=1 Tax=Acidocella aromatica TaxID=1303579 RepID=A0A840VU49_9PROT|nr:glucosaminidase domain-containing protein [Acidocella aromatica]MBB5373732.1 flagellar protein FlgJ [Acidocella aromatica]
MLLSAPHAFGNATPQKPSFSTTVEHVAGMLWYEMLSSMNENGMSPDALGAGGGDFQSMFLWNLAQNDFSKYDNGLLTATTRQIGGGASEAPATVSAAPMPLATALPSAGTGTVNATIQTEALEAAPEVTQPATDLVTQAKNFAKSVWPQITQAAQALGVPPVAVLAQTALETGWGAAAPGNNIFGVKASGGESGTMRATHEVIDGVLTPQTASFRNYSDLADSISDYVGLIQSGFSTATGQNTVAGFAQALQSGGYATDTNYASKIVNIAQSPLMAQVLQAIGGTSSIASTAGKP